MKKTLFGHTAAGEAVYAYELENANGMSAVILDYGCTIQSLFVPDGKGGKVDVVLGYDTVAEYETNGGYLGAAIGRIGNRIGKGKFTLNGKEYQLYLNDGPNHLHGGAKGFDKYVWNAEEKGDNVIAFSRVSPDGEEGYPGNLSVTITYELTDANELKLTYDADTDEDTIVNLTNHSYFNLDGSESVLDHTLQLFVEGFLENDGGCLPTGKILGFEEEPAFDFSEPKAIGRDINMESVQLARGGGYDNNYVLPAGDGLKKAAVLTGVNGISMEAWTTLPGMQLYSGNFLDSRAGKRGGHIDYRGGVCLETQTFPDAMAHPEFPGPILKKDEHFHTETVYAFK